MRRLGGVSGDVARRLYGTSDANKDGIPDILAVRSDGSVRAHPGGRSTVNATGTEVVGANTHWPKRLAVG